MGELLARVSVVLEFMHEEASVGRTLGVLRGVGAVAWGLRGDCICWRDKS